MQFLIQSKFRAYLMIGAAALLVLVGLSLLMSRGAAEDQSRAKRYDVLEAAVRAELADQKQSREEQAKQIDTLKESLVAQNATPEQLKEVDKLQLSQTDDYNARVRRLQEWLELLEDDPDRAIDGINQEAEAIARDLRGQNQSIDIPPVHGRGSFTGGSRFTDTAQDKPAPAQAAPDKSALDKSTPDRPPLETPPKE